MSATLYHNARLIDPASGRDEPGGLLVEDDRIADLGPNVTADSAAMVDCGGHVLCPGLVDMMAFVSEPGEGSLTTASRAAASGGVTTLTVMPNTTPPLDNIALVEFIARRARDTAIVNIHPMAAATKGLAGAEMSEIGLLLKAGAVAFTDGRKAVASARLMDRLLTYATAFDALVVQHVEDPELARGGCINQGELATRLGLPGIPVEAETVLLERDLRLAARAGARYHAAQLTCAQSLGVIRHAKAARARVSCGVAPQHFALNENAIGEYRTFAKTSPPLRCEEDRQAVAEALADGTIDVIVSAHDPQSEENKRQPFAQAADGVAGLETMLPLALELYHAGQAPLMRVLEAMTARPADLIGLPAGRLAAGAPADLLVFDLDTPWRIDTSRLHSKAKNSPYDGRPVQGRVLRTIVGGETVFTANGFQDAP